MRRPVNPQTLRALIALAAIVGAAQLTLFNGGGGPPEELTCEDCGALAFWHECEDCQGTGLAECWCEGAGGWPICSEDCFARSCAA